jgi:hypothetical protein
VKTCKWLLCVLMALTLTVGFAEAKKDGAKPAREKKAKKAKKARVKKNKGGLRGEYAIMTSVLNLTAAQQAEIAEIAKAQSEDKKALAVKLAPLKKELAEAKKAKDKAKCKELSGKIRELSAKSKAPAAAIQGVLTDEQKATWAKFGIYRSVSRKFGRAKLTDEQKKAVRDLCAKSGVKPTGNKKADAAAVKVLQKKIFTDILTDDQRKVMAPKKREKKPKPAGEKKPRKKKKAADQ